MEVESLWTYAAYLIGKMGAVRKKDSYVDFLRAHVPLAEPGSDKIHGQCLQALAELHEDVRPLCHEWLSKPNETLRFYALESLRYVGDMSSLKLLESLQWHQDNTPFFEHARLEVYDDLYWRLAGGLSREVMTPLQN